MNISYLVVAVLACAVAVFALQNTTPIDIRFLAWHLSNVPVAVLALVSLAAGLVIAGVPLSIGRWRSRRRVRALQAQVQQTQATLADREDPLTTRQRTTRGEGPATRSAGS
jgi:uncharacterized integral membrane protein